MIIKQKIIATLSIKYLVTTIENAIVFNNFHEGIHYGIIRSIKKFL